MKKIIIVSASLFLAAILYTNCNQGPGTKVTEVKAVGDSVKVSHSYTFDIQFQPKPPDDLVFQANDEQKVSFAWNEFLALNWRSSFSKDHKRDNPDTIWNYSSSTQKAPDLVVWETFAHRSELRPYNDNMLPFDAPPHYSFKAQPSLAPGKGGYLDLWDNLDENNEIGSCYLYGRVDTFNRDNLVLFQAKVNRDEYEYIYNNYPKKVLITAATKNTADNITQDSSYYPGINGAPCNCPKEKNVICLPCGKRPAVIHHGAQIIHIPGQTGSIEVKTAWRKLAAGEDASTFFTRMVITYSKGPNDKVYYSNEQYALIGIHIIHKTLNYPNFVFATWEHINVEKHHMGYVEIDTNKNEGPLVVNYPRLHPVPEVADSSTEYVHRELAKRNANSVWQNYRLVGVQTTLTNDSTTFSYFMANYVIESDPTLADFHGSGILTPFDGKANSLYQGHGYTMGGCQGCHGVAQTKFGGDESFLMDNFGKPVDTPDVASHRNKLQTYIKAIDAIQRRQALLTVHNH
ncbi:hypothetical protein ACX0G9_22915 [Flavitalea flava]